MSNETPDRVSLSEAIDAIKNTWDGKYLSRVDERVTTTILNAVAGGRLIRKDAACVEVKEGYKITGIQTPMGHWQGFVSDRWFSEALTIRTVEDVRREALEEAVRLLELPSGLMTPPAAQRIRNLIDNPAPSRETQLCPDCGISDDGIGCGCDYGLQTQPAPSPEPVAYMGVWPDGGTAWVYQNFPKYPHPDLKIVALYPTPPEAPASHAAELRKAKAEAWDQGWQDRLENEGLNCPIVSNPYRRSTDE